MKKIYIILSALVFTCTSFAQTINNAGMESWRTGTSGSAGTSTPLTFAVPTDWFSTDSLVFYYGQTFGGFAMIPDSSWQRQVFKESVITHGGSFSAKVMTARDSFVGNVPGSLANAEIFINIDPVSMMVSPPSYSGGTPVTQRVASVSAWVRYEAGIDSITGLHGDIDSGLLTVQVLSQVAGIDSVVGTGTVKIGPSSSFTQITANVHYTDSVNGADTLRIIFNSSGFTGALDSSTLYVDDVTMTSISGVTTTLMKSALVNVYPNPATETIHLDGPQNKELTCELFSVSGQIVATKSLAGNSTLDVSYLPAGLYFYTISDLNGNKVQRGKVAVNR